jgi:hypothetical protein
MAPDDRDQLFEKALARHLRSSAPSSPDATMLPGSPVDLCPDPELLAAYHDGSLSLDERSLWKQHVLGCDRCQTVLAHLETPLDLPVLSEATLNMAAEKEAAIQRAREKQTNENVVVLPQPASAAKIPAPARTGPRPSPVHTLRWLWLVPAGAIAASFIAWVSIHESKPVPAISSSPVEVAESREPASATPSARPESPATGEPKDKALSKEQAPNQERDLQKSLQSPAAAASASRDLATKAPENRLVPTQQSPFQYSPKSANGPSLSQQKQEQQIGRIAAGAAGGALDQKKLDLQAAAPEMAARLQPAPKPPAPPASSEPSFLDDNSVASSVKDNLAAAPPPPPPPSVTNTNSASAKVSAPSAVTESVEVTNTTAETATDSIANKRSKVPLENRAVMRAAALQNPHVFAAPGAKHLWRLGPAGSLEHSSDKGVTWTAQISGVYTDLLAGSAPSAKVSWVVGTSGTILRTTDGGTHWAKLDSPLNANLTAVTATDALHAKIAFAPDSQSGQIKSYETKDGGATWSPTAP